MENKNQNVVQLDQLSLTELKALHYDALKEFTRCQNNLQILIKKIEEIEQKQTVQEPVVSNKGD